MSMSYECWAYKNDKPWKMVHVLANNSEEAENLAWAKFRELGIEPDFVKCKQVCHCFFLKSIDSIIWCGLFYINKEVLFNGVQQ